MKTKNKGVKILTALLALSGNFAKASMDSAQLMGGWNLEKFVIISPEGKEQSFCRDMTGVIMYEKSGYMSVGINCGVQTEKVPADDYGNHLFYAGTFKITGDDVAHKITNSSTKSLIGKELVRKAANLTANKLVLTGKLGSKGETLRIEWSKPITL